MVTKPHIGKNGVAIGDVVMLRDRNTLMTVEGVRPTTFGVILDSCWFDHEDSLRFSSFPEKMLDIFPRTERSPQIKIGTEVRLRSRGPVMSIRGFRTKEGLRYAICVWTGTLGRERQRMFPVDCLTLTLLERFEVEDGAEI